MANKKEECKCPHCGSKDFFVHEFECFKASVDEHDNSIINCYHKSTGIDLVECASCKADITELSVNTNFTFNFQ